MRSPSISGSEDFLCFDRCSWTKFEPSDFDISQNVASVRKKRVNFSAWIDVAVFEGEQVKEFSMPCGSTNEWLRSFWHLDGQIAGWNDLQRGVDNINRVPWTLVACEDVIGQQTDQPLQLPVLTPSTSHVAWISNSVMHFDLKAQVLQMHGSSGSTNQRSSGQWVETWFLSPGRFHMCMKSRRIQIDDEQDDDSFKQKVQHAWNDLCNGDVFHLHMVWPQPMTWRSTRAHILVVQSPQEGVEALLARSEAFPVLQKHRAFLYSHGESVLECFNHLQIRSVCLRRDTKCLFEFSRHNQEHVVESHDPMWAPMGTLVHAHIRLDESDS